MKEITYAINYTYFTLYRTIKNVTMKSWLKLIAIAVFIFFWCYLVFAVLWKLPEQEVISMAVSNKPSSDKIDWKTVNLFTKTIPEDILVGSVNIETGRKNIEGIKVFYRKASASPDVNWSGQSILLLHGKKFTSETWEKLGTLDIMAALGHLVVAIDLPGYGITKEAYDGDKSKFIFSIIKSDLLNGSRPVLVSPSMSGEYSVKFVGEHADLLSGYIPVAPVATGSVPRNILQDVKVPTLIMYGDKDLTPMAKQAPEDLKVLPNSQEVVFKNAGHAAYLDQPEQYHKLLYNFMELLQQ